jgi:hypothetical protein
LACHSKIRDPFKTGTATIGRLDNFCSTGEDCEEFLKKVKTYKVIALIVDDASAFGERGLIALFPLARESLGVKIGVQAII